MKTFLKNHRDLLVYTTLGVLFLVAIMAVMGGLNYCAFWVATKFILVH